jgi:hypothetical protein
MELNDNLITLFVNNCTYVSVSLSDNRKGDQINLDAVCKTDSTSVVIKTSDIQHFSEKAKRWILDPTEKKVFQRSISLDKDTPTEVLLSIYAYLTAIQAFDIREYVRKILLREKKLVIKDLIKIEEENPLISEDLKSDLEDKLKSKELSGISCFMFLFRDINVDIPSLTLVTKKAKTEI